MASGERDGKSSESSQTGTRTCSRCGTVAEGPAGGVPEGWSFEMEKGRIIWSCGPCIRRNIRAIEGKLPQEWWE